MNIRKHLQSGLPLVLDGEVHADNLRRGGLTEEWLRRTAASAGFSDIKKVFFLCLNTQGKMLIQGKGCEETKILQAIVPEKAVWLTLK